MGFADVSNSEAPALLLRVGLAVFVCLFSVAGSFVGELALAAGPADSGVLEFTASERAQIDAMGPWPPPVKRDASNRVEGQALAIEFGRALFGDTRLSRDGKRSCASCHRPDLAFQDGRAVAVGLAPGVRNTPTLLDSGQLRWLGWDGGHDSLWWASLEPMLDKREMGHSLASLASTVRSVPAWTMQYRQVFGVGLPADNKRLAIDIAKALAAYGATLVSPRTAFDDFRDALTAGDTNAAASYPIDAQRGLRLFAGEAGCTSCHSGARFSNGEFADIGIPFFIPGGVDAGRHSGLKTLMNNELNRLGLFNDAVETDSRALLTRHIYIDHRHFGEFKVPSLRQLTHTAPYMHNGSLNTLEEVVKHYNNIDLDRLHADGARLLRPLSLDAAELADLVAFLRSLSSQGLTAE